MSTRTGVPGTISSGAVGSAQFNSLPGGWIGYVAVTSDVPSLTHSTDPLTGLSVTVTAGTSRRLKITGVAHFQAGTATDDAQLNIQEDATIVQGGAIATSRTTVSYGAREEVIRVPSAGSHTYDLTGGLAAGTGPITMKAATNKPAYVLVEDMGPS